MIRTALTLGMRGRRIASAAVVVLLLMLTGPAGAAEGDPSAQAREHYEQGVALMEASNYAQAELSFEKAFELKRHYQIAGNLGACEVELGKSREAAEHLSFALSDLPDDAEHAEQRGQLQGLFDRAKARVSTLRIVVEGSNAAEATVRLDGQPLTSLTGPVFLDPGKHRAEAAAPGGRSVGVDLKTRVGEEQTVRLVLPGVRRSGQEDGPDEEPQDDDGSLSAVPFWVGLGVGVATMTAGAVVYGLGSGAESDGDAARDDVRARGGVCDPGCPEVVDEYASADGLYDAGTGLLIGGGAVLLGAAIYGAVLLGTDSEEAGADTALVPLVQVGPTGGSLGIAARF